jgi:cation diffusion facilitator CzcD-associated flavoprotein CzcO
MSEHQVVVIGAGPSGVAVAVSLLDCGVRPLLVDRADYVGSSWRGRYDRLKLNTGRPLSPAKPALSPGHFHLPHAQRCRRASSPARARRRHRAAAGHDGEPNRSQSGGWLLQTSTGDIDARQVVVATGYEHTPFIPEWPGKDSLTGELLHSSTYRNPIPLRGKRVLVVGAGSSGIEIVVLEKQEYRDPANVPARNTVSPQRDSIYAWCSAPFSCGVTPTCNWRADQSRHLRAQHE